MPSFESGFIRIAASFTFIIPIFEGVSIEAQDHLLKSCASTKLDIAVMIAYNDFAIIGSERSYRILKITSSVVHMHKMKFSFKNAIGHPYGTCFEIKNDQLHRMSIVDSVVKEDDTIDDDNNGTRIVKDSLLNDAADNRTGVEDQLVEDNNKIALENAQKLTAVDVKVLKDQGAKPSDLIAELAKNNKNFEHRTQYSKEKYLAKKKKKHSNVICIFRSSLRLLSHVHYHKDTDKICGLRLDHLSSILNYADVQPGTKVLVVENCAGLVTGGVLERLDGQGVCLHFHRNDQVQAIPALNAMNFDEKQMSSFYPVSFKRLADNSVDLRENCESTTKVEASQHNNEKKRQRSQSPMIEESGEKSTNEDESNERRRALRARREEAIKIFQESTFDSLIIACKQHPLTFLKHLADKMEPSSPLVIYSLHVRLLLDCYTWLREQDIAINLRLSENFYRAHQVLPNRTHPEMNQLVAGGFLLTGIFVQK